jgi:hypothetical protein
MRAQVVALNDVADAVPPASNAKKKIIANPQDARLGPELPVGIPHLGADRLIASEGRRRATNAPPDFSRRAS